MSNLHLDFESRSCVDLKKVGVYAYAEHPSTEILCAAYAIDEGPVRTAEFVKGEYDEPLLAAIDRATTITCHNAQFERTILRLTGPKYGLPAPPIEKFRCTMVMSYSLGLPGSLEEAGAAVGLETQKDKVGHRLMMAMCKPRAPRKGDVGPGPFWRDMPADRERLYAYCAQDVEAERALEKRLLPLKQSELELWFLDQRINDRGVHVDVELADAATNLVEKTLKRLNAEMRDVSKGEVVSVTDMAGLLRFCKARGLSGIDSLAKGPLAELLVREDLDDALRRCLEIRREGGRASVTKIRALANGRSADGRARGLLQFHAAGTGRWAGRRFQPQNLKRPEAEDQVEGVISSILDREDPRFFELLHGPALSAVGDAIRGMVAAPIGKLLTAADYSNIEGRVLAWIAGEQWKLDAFRRFDCGSGPDLYRLAYARSFGKRPDDVGKPERQIGKVMELALGYQGGPGAFLVLAKGYGLKVGDYCGMIRANAPEMFAKADKAYSHRGRATGTKYATWTAAETLKLLWRAAHPRVESFWQDIERAAILAVQEPGAVVRCGRLKFRKAGSWLFMQLPSGRAMAYPCPVVMDVPYFGETKQALTYKAVPDPLKPNKIIPEADGSINMKWARISTYGGMLTENAVQAIARDMMAVGMTALDAAGYQVILTVHDEVVSEDYEAFGSEDEFKRLMTTLPASYDGLPIAAGSFRAKRYRK